MALALGMGLSLGVAGAARAAGWLTRDGLIAAAAVGTLVFGFGGFAPAALLVTFFISSSLLTRWRADRKTHPEHRRGRSGSQVLANGGVATVLSTWYALSPSPGLAVAIAGAIAAATADTWATEVGLLSRRPPRLITTWQPVTPGTSGGITVLGTLAGAGGAAVIAFFGAFLHLAPWAPVWLGGIAAMVVDSLLGATVEGRRPDAGNNLVNLAATLAGAGLSALAALLLR
ncbi:MAG: DUF92 domain-containing protein [Armatimonadota bacterium]|nr:DUF92 domain-containing protein [Armatimonadota bacterium]MDR7494118.1 DUF92 domain-containing protein [Armatimonadota bacterium]MDR7498916.1 DUF92 domain-containing protein [Armatimonadota bacterium]MDR7504375.1 DUF92 domain-containing protein [Armatimonadota bacterium]MDR7547962.1 DUF92 domain-containing protein [Armatimonadota bacterium]